MYYMVPGNEFLFVLIILGANHNFNRQKFGEISYVRWLFDKMPKPRVGLVLIHARCLINLSFMAVLFFGCIECLALFQNFLLLLVVNFLVCHSSRYYHVMLKR